MTDEFPLPNIWSQIAWRCTPVTPASLSCTGFDSDVSNLPEDLQTFVTDSYPHNHTYTVREDRLVPNRQLAVRVAGLSRYYPAPLTSLVDVSCSKGFFVFQAAAIASCERALGIDLSDECLNACQQLRMRFARAERVRFERLTIPQLAASIDEFGGPFQTALLINTYQYLFFGSSIAPAICQDHREIFRLLRTVCSGRLIFHNRVSLDDLQTNVKERAALAGTGKLYNAEAIYQAASEFFKVTALRRWLGRPVWLLDAN